MLKIGFKSLKLRVKDDDGEHWVTMNGAHILLDGSGHTVHHHNSMLNAISKLGGLNASEAKAQGIDPADMHKRGYGVKRIFRNGSDSKGYDEMAETLRGYGYDVPDANALVKKVSESINQGVHLYTEKGNENIASIGHQNNFDDYALEHESRKQMLHETAKRHDDEFGTQWHKEISGLSDMSIDDIAAWEQDLHDDREYRGKHK
jgi:hypothetical protein